MRWREKPAETSSAQEHEAAPPSAYRGKLQIGNESGVENVPDSENGRNALSSQLHAGVAKIVIVILRADCCGWLGGKLPL